MIPQVNCFSVPICLCAAFRLHWFICFRDFRTAPFCLCFSETFVSAFADTVSGLWSGRNAVVYPSDLKSQIQKFSSRFVGYEWVWLLLCYCAYLSPCHWTTIIGRSAHFSLHWLLRDWRNPHLLRSFQWPNNPVDFFEFLSISFAAFSKPQ